MYISSLSLLFFLFPVIRSYETDKASIAKADELKADVVTRYDCFLTYLHFPHIHVHVPHSHTHT